MIVDSKSLGSLPDGTADVARRSDEVFGQDLVLRRFARGGSMNHVLWAACKSDQYSSDASIGGSPNGAFSYFFCRHIRDTQGRISREQLLKLVRASLKHEGFSQVPQLEGPKATGAGQVFGG